MNRDLVMTGHDFWSREFCLCQTNDLKGGDGEKVFQKKFQQEETKLSRMEDEEGRGSRRTPPLPLNHQQEGTGGDVYQGESEHYTLNVQTEGGRGR